MTIGGGGVVAFTGSGTAGFQLANGRIADLRGVFGVSGASLGQFLVAGGDVSYGAGFDIVAVQLAAGFTLKLPLPGELHSGITYTHILIDNEALLNVQQFASIWLALDVLLAVQSLVP